MRDTNALSNLAQQWEDWPGLSAVSPYQKHQQQSMEYGLKLSSRDYYAVGYEGLEADINIDEPTTVTLITTTSTKQNQDIKKNTGTWLIN